MSNTIIKNILNARKSATSRVPKVKAEDLHQLRPQELCILQNELMKNGVGQMRLNNGLMIYKKTHISFIKKGFIENG